MVETKVVLCDLCKKQVANLKCELCGKDLCSGNCSQTFHIYYGAGSNHSVVLYLCQDDCCNKVIYYIAKLFQTDDKKELSKRVKELFLNYVKKGLILNELEDKTEK